jgi:hypothetical protein
VAQEDSRDQVGFVLPSDLLGQTLSRAKTTLAKRNEMQLTCRSSRQPESQALLRMGYPEALTESTPILHSRGSLEWDIDELVQHEHVSGCSWCAADLHRGVRRNHRETR